MGGISRRNNECGSGSWCLEEVNLLKLGKGFLITKDYRWLDQEGNPCKNELKRNSDSHKRLDKFRHIF